MNPACRAACSTACISWEPSPVRRLRRCTTSLAMSARWGWFGAHAGWELHRADDPFAISRATRKTAFASAVVVIFRHQASACSTVSWREKAHRRSGIDRVDQEPSEASEVGVRDWQGSIVRSHGIAGPWRLKVSPSSEPGKVERAVS